MKKKEVKNSSKKPFFANLLSSKEQNAIKGGATQKDPSDNDETSDEEDDKDEVWYPQDHVRK